MANCERLVQNVISGNEDQVINYVTELVEVGVNPIEIINEGLIAGMNVVGADLK